MCSVGPSNDSSHDDDTPEIEIDQKDNSDDEQHEYPMRLQNSDVIANLDGKLERFSGFAVCGFRGLWTCCFYNGWY